MDTRRWLYKGIGTFSLFFLLVLPAYVFGGSFQGEGVIIQTNPVDGRDIDNGRCYLFLGPHGDFLGENEYLLQLGDEDLEDGFDAEIMGKFTVVGRGRIRSTADNEEVEEFFQGFVDKQIGRDDVEAIVRQVTVKIRQNPRRGAEVIRCRVTIRVDLLDGNTLVDRTTLRYSGVGLHFENFHGTFQEDVAMASSSSVQALPQSPPPSAASQNSCREPTLNLNTQFCQGNEGGGDSNCLLNFAGFRWWTNYQFSNDSEGFYNGGLGTPFNPGFASVDQDGLHLKIGKVNLGGGNNWAGSEVVVMRHLDNTPARLGFGTYLVSARIKSAASWDDLDRNVAFGVFPFEKDKTGTVHNPYRELDLAEISHWGHAKDQPCNNRLCQGNAQFALQIWDAEEPNLFRYSIAPGINEITLVMKWNGANQPVTFQQYNGLFSLENLPGNPDNEWTTPATQNKFVPASQCQRFHLNFWLGNYSNHPTPHPGPSNGQNQEIIVSNFQFQPLN